jgi:uncharacterized protein YjbI with pentapeptide repeats
MANPEHVEVVKQGAEAIAKWRAENPGVRLDLHEADLSEAGLIGANLTRADLRKANLHRARLHHATLHQADLSEANLHKANLLTADLHEASLYRADLHEAYLLGANLRGAGLGEANLHRTNLRGVDLYQAWIFRADLREAHLHGAKLGGAHLDGADLCGADLFEADLHGADLRKAKLHGAKLHDAKLHSAKLGGADLTRADLRGAELHKADLFEANLANADLSGVRGAERVYHLETVRFISTEDTQRADFRNDARYFETCYRPWPERGLDWERLRVVGRLPLFGLSYTTLIVILTVFYGLARYDEVITRVHAWAEQTAPSTDHPLLHMLASLLKDHVHSPRVPDLSLWLLVSTSLLVVASTLYTVACPSRIKEFSRDQWCDQLNRPLLHYWAKAWKYRYVRLICAACYALGAFTALWVLGNKVWEVGRYIWKYAVGSWWWW